MSLSLSLSLSVCVCLSLCVCVLWLAHRAALEVLHALLGMVRSPLPTVALQLFSRLALVGVVEHAANTAVTAAAGASVVAARSAHASVPFAMMTLCWGLTEVVRYSFYCLSALGLAKKNPLVQLVTYLRYTLFYVLCASRSAICTASTRYNVMHCYCYCYCRPPPPPPETRAIA